MEIGINIQSSQLDSINHLKGFDFIELADFVLPQYLCDNEAMKRFYQVLDRTNYKIKCLEGPIRDIKPESGDPEILAVTKKRFLQLIEIAAKYQIKYILFNTTFDPLVRFDFYTDMWLTNNKNFWDEIIPVAEEKEVICLYCNVWDDTPDYLFELFEYINSPYFKFGMDIGHLRYISKVPMNYWFNKLENHIEYICLHDNFGQRDDHLAIGDGNIDFNEVITEIKKLKKQPDLCIQLFNPANLQDSLNRLAVLLKRNT